MININLGRLRKNILVLYKSHFSLFLFILISSLLAIGLSVMNEKIIISASIAFVLMLISLLYYFSYFKKYRLLTDNYIHYKFAYVGSILAIIFPKLGFGEPSFYNLLIFQIQAILDGISLGLLGSYSLDFSNLKMEGFFAKSYIYSVNLIVNIAFIASLVSVISETIQTKRELKNALIPESLNVEFFNKLTPIKVRAILKQVKNGTFQIGKHEKQLLKMLEKSNSKEAKDIMLQVFQSTKDSSVFKLCLAYFADKRDYRFRRK